jgi:hypothetical protein
MESFENNIPTAFRCGVFVQAILERDSLEGGTRLLVVVPATDGVARVYSRSAVMNLLEQVVPSVLLYL